MELLSKIVYYFLLLSFVNVLLPFELVSFLEQEVEVCISYEIQVNNPKPVDERGSEAEDSKEEVDDLFIDFFSVLNFNTFLDIDGNAHQCNYYNTFIEIPSPPP